MLPKQNSSGGKPKLGRISKMGNRYLRKLLVVGAHAVLFHRKPHTDPLSMWAKKLIDKKPFKRVAVALANKMARRLRCGTGQARPMPQKQWRRSVQANRRWLRLPGMGNPPIAACPVAHLAGLRLSRRASRLMDVALHLNPGALRPLLAILLLAASGRMIAALSWQVRRR